LQQGIEFLDLIKVKDSFKFSLTSDGEVTG